LIYRKEEKMANKKDIGNGRVVSRSKFGYGFYPSSEIPKDQQKTASDFAEDAVNYYTNPQEREKIQEKGREITAIAIRDALVSAELQKSINLGKPEKVAEWETIILHLAEALWVASAKDLQSEKDDCKKIAIGNVRKAANILISRKTSFLSSAIENGIPYDIFNALEIVKEEFSKRDFRFADRELRMKLIDRFCNTSLKFLETANSKTLFKGRNGDFFTAEQYFKNCDDFIKQWKKEIESEKP